MTVCTSGSIRNYGILDRASGI